MLRPFFHAFRINFKKATQLWIPLFLGLILLVFDTLFLMANGGNALQRVLLAVATLLFAGLLIYLFPLIARFEMRGKGLLSTDLSLFCAAFACFVGHDFSESGSNSFFTLSPIAFLRWSILWFGIWFASAAYLNGKILLKIWGKHKSR